jgi:hypothetical protein
MSQLALALSAGEDRRTGIITWDRRGKVCGADYLMIVDGKWNGWVVAHCGHPTALRPYYVDGPDGQHFQAYRLLAEAKDVAIKGRRP